MKLAIFGSAALLTFSVSASVQANTLFDYAAYSKTTIRAECSDYMGKVAAPGAIELGDFLIRSNDYRSCALQSGSRIHLERGAIQYTNQDRACVESRVVSGSGTYSFQKKRVSVNYDALNAEMDQASATLKSAKTGGDVVVMNVDGERGLTFGTLALKANQNQTLVINISGKSVNVQSMGVTLAGGVNAENIIWNFYEATTLRVRLSGADPKLFGLIGLPGTFLAPNAVVNFNDALITGALYAREILGKAEHPGLCQGSVSGQINGECLIRRSLGIGCGDAIDHPDQRQNDQGQRP